MDSQPKEGRSTPPYMRHPRCWIIHVDLDAFFAWVEELLHPSLVGKSIIVCYREGVVATASYPARKYGVTSEMPVELAAELCPAGVFLPAKKEVYLQYSERVMSLLEEYSSRMEQASIDEAFLEVTHAKDALEKAKHIGRTIQARMAKEIGLSCSIGIASNKLISKIACNVGKPGGFVVVPPEHERSFLAPLRVDRLPGVGASTKTRLQSLGVHTIGDLAKMSRDQLLTEFGERGRSLHDYSQGMDDSPVKPTRLNTSGGRRLH